MKKKRVINKLKLMELSAVDKPAQEGALSVIMKRHSNILMTLADSEGHAHLLDGSESAGETSHHGGEPGASHTHPFIVKNGQIVIGETHGHTHQVDSEEFNMILMTEAMREDVERDLLLENNAKFASFKMDKINKSYSLEDGSFSIENYDDLVKVLKYCESNDTDDELYSHIVKRADDLGVSLQIVKSSNGVSINEAAACGDDKELDIMSENEVTALQKKVDDLNKELTLAKSISQLNDAERVHYEGLEGKEQSQFLAKSKEQRALVLKNLEDENKVIYKSLSGHEFRQSDDARLIEMAKQADADRIELKKQRDANEQLVLTKRAETELEFMPGTVETRVALLKAVESIEDEAVKEEVNKSLKAKNAQMSKAFETVGSSEEAVFKGSRKDAEAELTKLANEYVSKAEKPVDFYTAYDIVSKGNPELYAKAITG